MFSRVRTIKRILYAPISILVLAVLLVFLVRGAIRAYQDERVSRRELQNLQQSSAELAEREAFLQREIERLSSDRGLEEELRNKYPVAKEGESVVIIVDPKEDEDGSIPAESKGFWSRILDFFR